MHHRTRSLLVVAAFALGCGGRSTLSDAPGKTSSGGECASGQERACYPGPAGTEGVGPCKAGTQQCSGGHWGECSGAVLPGAEICDGMDNNCDGEVDEVCPCPMGQQRSCYSGPPGTAGVGVCQAGTQDCTPSGWGPCSGEVLPSSEVCDLVDNDCNGAIDDQACPAGTMCGTNNPIEDSAQGWVFNGSAFFDPSSSTAFLTEKELSKAGTFFYQNPLVADSFVVSFNLALGYVDGAAFVLQTNGSTALSQTAGGLGISGLTGYAVAFDTHQGSCPGDLAEDHISITDLSQPCGTLLQVPLTLPPPVKIPGDWLGLEIHFDHGAVSVFLTAVGQTSTLVSGFAIPGFPVGQKFFYGFGASNWYAKATWPSAWVPQMVQKVSVVFPSATCF